MKLTKKEEAEVIKVYDTWLHSYLNGDVKTYDSYFDDQYHFIGSTDNEDFLNRKDTTGFFKKTADQLAGKVEIRNNIRTIEKFNELIFVTERFDAYFLIESEWSYYGKFRFTSALQKKKEGWRFIYQHFSTPDSKAQEGETIGTEQIAAENLMLREAVKRRTTELEQKNRELAIEAATERVRTQAMAMQHPDDLDRVNKEILNQLNLLQIPGLTGVTFYLVNENGWVNAWDFSSPGNMGNQNSYSLQFDFKKYEMMGEPFQILLQTDLNYFVADYPLEKLKKAVYELEEINPAVASVFREALAGGALNHQWTACARISNGLLGVDLVSPPSGDTKTIVLKMAAAFNQAYTRFLDLQKAEKQAKEAQIETALEKVRSRTMAMQKSEELLDLVKKIYSEIEPFGVSTTGITIALFREEENAIENWFADNLHSSLLQSYKVVGQKNKVFKQIWEDWKNKNPQRKVYLEGPDKRGYDNYILTETDYRQLPEELKEEIHSHKTVCFTFTYFKYGYFESVDLTIPAEENAKILLRFVKVFEQTYTRFLDLQKAEAQAKEAEIELALERVRARTMAMHHSDELIEVVKTLNKQFLELRPESVANWLSLVNVESNSMKIIGSVMNGFLQEYIANGSELPSYQNDLDEFKKGIPHWQFSLPKEEILRIWRESFEFDEADLPEGVTKYHLLHIRHTFGFYGFGSWEKADEETIAILSRFCKVFEQTYTRFLDLQKAEAQVREAQIEAALERVRSRTMSMQKSEELKDVVKVMNRQFDSLAVAEWGCSIMIFDKKANRIENWVAESTNSDLSCYIIEGQRHPVYKRLWKHWEQQAPTITLHHADEVKREFDNFWLYETDYKRLPDEVKSTVLNEREIFLTYSSMHHGLISVAGYKQLSEDQISILDRFSKVFEQTYTRFLDLQKAEAQAHEAQIETALEKVRSRSLSMHNSDELKDVVAVVFEKLMELGFELEKGAAIILTFIRGSKDHFEWIADPTQSYVQCIRMPYYENPLLADISNGWEKGTDYYSREYSFGVKNDFFSYAFENTDYKHIPDAIKETILNAENYSYSIAFEKNSAIGVPDATGKIFSEEKEEILKRFARVFEQAYIRFLDLQIAEAQAREAQIEAALERVRSRTMGMHQSSELSEVGEMLFQQIKQLGIDAEGSWFWFIDLDTEEIEIWVTADGKLAEPITVSGSDFWTFNKEVEGWKNKEPFLQLSMPYQEARELVHTIFGIELSSQKESTFYHLLQVRHKYGFLGIGTWHEASEEEIRICSRFAKVFEQTYTRFLDLQKAEAQAREAQIEVALERTRNQSMLMKHSDEIKSISNAFHEQLIHLGIPSEFSYVWLPDEANKSHQFWASWTEMIAGEDTLQSKQVTYPLDKSEPYTAACYEAWGNPELILDAFISPAEIAGFFGVWQELLAGATKLKTEFFPEGIYYSEAYMRYGCFGINIRRKLTEEEKNILKRFSVEFERAYTRFLDLQKAEAQAREAQIEAALEKVRSRSLAMHSTNELGEVVTVIVEKLTELDVVLDANGVVLCTYFEDSKNVLHWIASPDFSFTGSYLLPYFDHIIFNDAWNSKESGDAYFSKNYSVEEKNSFWEFAFEHSDYRYFPDDFKQWVFQNDKHILSFAWQKNSAILIPSHTGVVPTEDEAAILKRFAKVFEQAYTRFLDLQRAETQAREAQIEAALERVRSKAMSMHSSEDLAAAIRVFYLEMKGLSVTPRRLGVGLVSRKNRIAEISSMNTTEQGESIEVLGKLEMTGHPVLDSVYDHWLLQKEYHPILRGNEIREYYSLIRPHIAYPDYPTDAVQFGYFFPFTEGSIYAWTEQELHEDELKIYRKFTSVLSLTYKRYKDLKDAEANALEAVRRASLDRVRAEIASMRTVDDLQRITPIIWHELTMLGVPFVRCGVFIIDESTEHIQVHLSSPDGSALGALNLPFNSSELTLNSVNHWRQGIIFKTHWDKQEFLNFMQSMIKEGQVQNQETYQGAARPPESLHLHFVPFKSIVALFFRFLFSHFLPLALSSHLPFFRFLFFVRYFSFFSSLPLSALLSPLPFPQFLHLIRFVESYIRVSKSTLGYIKQQV